MAKSVETAMSPEFKEELRSMRNDLLGSTTIEALYFLQDNVDNGYDYESCECTQPRELEVLNRNIAVGIYDRTGNNRYSNRRIDIYINHGEGDNLIRLPDLIMSKKGLDYLRDAKKYYEAETDAMVWREYTIQGVDPNREGIDIQEEGIEAIRDVHLSREDIETLLNFAEKAFGDCADNELQEPHQPKYGWADRGRPVISHNPYSTEKPEKYKFIMLSPCEEGIVAVYEADNMEEPLISEIPIETLKNLPAIIMKKRMQKYMIMPKIDSTQPKAGVVGDMFNRRIDLRWNHTDAVTHDMHGLSVVGEGRYMLTYKPENTVDTDGAQIQFDAATQELAKYESELGELGISIEGSSGGIRTGGAVLNPGDIEGILKDLKQSSDRDPYFATYFGDVDEGLEVPLTGINIPEDLWSLAKREEYKVIEAIRDPITGIVGIGVEPLSRE